MVVQICSMRSKPCHNGRRWLAGVKARLFLSKSVLFGAACLLEWHYFLMFIRKTSEKKQANLRKVIPNISYTDSRWQRVLIEFMLRRWSLKGHTGECYFTRGEESNENQLVWYPCWGAIRKPLPGVLLSRGRCCWLVGVSRLMSPWYVFWRYFFVGGWRTLDWIKTSHLDLIL